jgi:hypothetical protein
MSGSDLARHGIRLFLGFVLLVGVIVAAGYLSAWVVHTLDLDMPPRDGPMVRRFIIIGTATYVVLTAIPFVPGAEIGMAMLSLFGASVAPLVYAATVVSLTLAYAVGRLVPPEVTGAGLRWLGMRRAADLLVETTGLAPGDRLQSLVDGSGDRRLAFASRYRYIALALAINVPGNIVIGGGGGIAMLAGLSGVFAPVPFVLTVMIAVLPVPLAIVVLGHAP